MTISKLLILFICSLFSIGLMAQKSVLDKTLDVNFYQKPLEDVLVSVSKKTGVNISFNPDLLKNTKAVTLNAKQVKLGDFLDVILDDTNIAYTVSGKQIVLTSFDPNKREFSFPMKQLSGFIEDDASGERLPFAYLYTLDGAIAVSTNEYGYYSFEVPENTESIYVSYLGYKDTLINLSDLQGGKLNVELSNNTLLEEVVIKETSKYEPIADYDIHVSNSLNKMKRSQSFGGQMDVVRYIHTLPGVSTGADGLGGFSVRGGNADNNLILLDGIPVYNSSHALGVFSIFDESSIKNTQFFRSHIPAQYGGRLSSVLDIRTVEGNLEEFSGEVGIGLLTANAFIEGPLLKNKISYTISGRRTIFDPYLQPISKFVKESQDREGETDYYFGDLNAKLQFVINPKNRIYISYYGGRDVFTDETNGIVEVDNTESSNGNYYNWQWGNTLTSLRWSSLINDKVFSNVSLYSSTYDFEATNYSFASVDTFGVNMLHKSDASLFNTSIVDIGAKWDVDYYINAENKAKIGLNAVHHKFQPSLVTSVNRDVLIERETQLDSLSESVNVSDRVAQELELYYDHQYKIGGTTINAGIRGSLIASDGESYFSLQPRFALKTKITRNVFGKISGNITSQYLHLLASSGLGLPTDIWIPSTSKIKPQTAYHASAGIDVLVAGDIIVSSELYYKNLRNILNLKEGAVFSVIEDTNWEDDIPVGIGNAYGWETSVSGSLGKHNLNLNYTYGFSKRRFSEINSGRAFYSRFDRRHQLNSSYQYQFNKNISINALFTLATGHPQTLPTTIFEGEVLYTEKNNQRLPQYDRLDVSFQIDNDYSWGSQTITIGAYNVYNKKNPYYYFISFPADNTLSFTAKQVTIFPILPNVSYRLRF